MTNPGFENGLTGWTSIPGGSTQSTSPAAYDGSSYFFAGNSVETIVEQTINLSASGFTDTQIDTDNLNIVFGGRVRTGSQNPASTGSITVTIFDANGQVLQKYTAVADNTLDRWELVGSSQSLPAHARSVQFQFTAIANGAENDSYLDGAFLMVEQNSVRPDMGADGDTSTQNTQNVPSHLVLTSPKLYVDWLDEAPLQVTWDSFGNVGDLPVRIDLYQDGANGPQFLTNITPSTPDIGSYTWIAADSSIPYGTYGLRIQISYVGEPDLFDRSTETFTVPENTTAFYVNDGSTVGDQYTTAPGSNRNDGRLPSAPKPFPNNVLRIYTLGAGETLYIDNGNYALLRP